MFHSFYLLSFVFPLPLFLDVAYVLFVAHFAASIAIHAFFLFLLALVPSAQSFHVPHVLVFFFSILPSSVLLFSFACPLYHVVPPHDVSLCFLFHIELFLPLLLHH